MCGVATVQSARRWTRCAPAEPRPRTFASRLANDERFTGVTKNSWYWSYRPPLNRGTTAAFRLSIGGGGWGAGAALLPSKGPKCSDLDFRVAGRPCFAYRMSTCARSRAVGIDARGISGRKSAETAEARIVPPASAREGTPQRASPPSIAFSSRAAAVAARRKRRSPRHWTEVNGNAKSPRPVVRNSAGSEHRCEVRRRLLNAGRSFRGCPCLYN